VYGLPDEAQEVVRVLLLASKYQVDLAEILQHAASIPFNKQSLPIFTATAHVAIPEEIKTLLQVGLYQQRI
jgi:hypothetical protein